MQIQLKKKNFNISGDIIPFSKRKIRLILLIYILIRPIGPMGSDKIRKTKIG